MYNYNTYIKKTFCCYCKRYIDGQVGAKLCTYVCFIVCVKKKNKKICPSYDTCEYRRIYILIYNTQREIIILIVDDEVGKSFAYVVFFFCLLRHQLSMYVVYKTSCFYFSHFYFVYLFVYLFFCFVFNNNYCVCVRAYSVDTNYFSLSC